MTLFQMIRSQPLDKRCGIAQIRMCVVGVIRIYNADGQVKNISNHPNRKSKIGIVRYDYGLLEISCVSVNEKICSEVDIGAFFFDCVNFDEFSNAASRRYQWAR